MFFKSLPMTGFNLQTAGVGSNWSTNWDTSTVQPDKYLGIENAPIFLKDVENKENRGRVGPFYNSR